MSEKHRDADAQLIAKVRTALNGQLAQLDADTLADLRRARQQAVERFETQRRRTLRITAWVPAGAFAMAVTAALVFALRNHKQALAPEAELPDFELLADSENLEMIKDLEFYQWLDRADATNG